MKTIDLTGLRFGKWIVVGKGERPTTASPSKPSYWRCKCDCGNTGLVPSHNLKSKKSASCGCTNKLESYKALYNFLCRMSVIGNKTCDLTFQEFLKFTSITKCHYCNTPIQWTEHNLSGGGSYQLDRKNNLLGYNKDNCVVCCLRCNYAKGSRYTYDEWYAMNVYFRNNTAKNIGVIEN